MGQLFHRLVRPYRRTPSIMAQLVDSSLSDDHKKKVAMFLCRLKPCCLEKLFAQPVVQAARDESADHADLSVVKALTQGNVNVDLQLAFRAKVSNVEIELNFARATHTRSTTHGKSCLISSMLSKHVTSELKLAQRRSIDAGETASSNLKSSKQGRVEHGVSHQYGSGSFTVLTHCH